MPLRKLQANLLRLLAANRNPESYVAGAIALNRDGPRFSGDIDIFNDGDERLAATAEADAALIAGAGLNYAGRRRAGQAGGAPWSKVLVRKHSSIGLPTATFGFF